MTVPKSSTVPKLELPPTRQRLTQLLMVVVAAVATAAIFAAF